MKEHKEKKKVDFEVSHVQTICDSIFKMKIGDVKLCKPILRNNKRILSDGIYRAEMYLNKQATSESLNKRFWIFIRKNQYEFCIHCVSLVDYVGALAKGGHSRDCHLDH